MPVFLSETAVQEVVKVLRADLPSELVEIDTEKADGTFLPKILPSDVHDFYLGDEEIPMPRGAVVDVWCSETLGAGEFNPSEVVHGRLTMDHLVTVRAVVLNRPNMDASVLVKHAHRFMAAIFRVLVLQKYTLGNAPGINFVRPVEGSAVTYRNLEGDQICREARGHFRVRTLELNS